MPPTSAYFQLLPETGANYEEKLSVVFPQIYLSKVWGKKNQENSKWSPSLGHRQLNTRILIGSEKYMDLPGICLHNRLALIGLESEEFIQFMV